MQKCKGGLVIFKASHPFGPIIRPGTPGPGPDACRAESLAPFERPQLLEPCSSDGIIHENAVDRLLVPVDGETLHGIGVAGPAFTIITRRGVCMLRPPAPEPAIQEQGDL